MTDYDKATGSGGIIRIRDTGTTVEYYIHAGFATTFVSGIAWSATGTGGGAFTYPTGAPLLLLGSASITTSQDVTLSIANTHTTGLGGPTSLTVHIDRAVVPGAPTLLPIANIKPTSFDIPFNGPSSDGGAAIDHYLVRYGKTNPPESGTYVEFSTTVGSPNTRTGLDPGALYYVRVYAHNAVGYSASSAILSARTLGAVRIKVGGVLRLAVAYTKKDGVMRLLQPFVKAGGVIKPTV